MRSPIFSGFRRSSTLTKSDMARSVQNAANYKQRLVESDRQNNFRPLYLDNAATTPTDPRVIDKMMPYITGACFGNPHSVSHAYGWNADAAVEAAREQVF